MARYLSYIKKLEDLESRVKTLQTCKLKFPEALICFSVTDGFLFNLNDYGPCDKNCKPIVVNCASTVKKENIQKLNDGEIIIGRGFFRVAILPNGLSDEPLKKKFKQLHRRFGGCDPEMWEQWTDFFRKYLKA